MQIEKPRLLDLDDSIFVGHVNKLKVDQKISSEERLQALNAALGIVSELYKRKDIVRTIRGFNQIISNSSGMIESYLKRKENQIPLSLAEEITIYTLCQAANDTAGIFFDDIVNSPKISEQKKDEINRVALYFIERQIQWGGRFGDETIQLRALNNSTHVHVDEATRLAFHKGATTDGIDKAKKILKIQSEKIRHAIGWAKMRNVVRSNDEVRDIEFYSAKKDKMMHPTNDKQLRLKYVANSQNRLAVLNILLARITTFPDIHTPFLEEAKEALIEADQYHIGYLEGKETGEEFIKRKLAIHSNLADAYIEETLPKNFGSIDLKVLYEGMDSIHNHFVKNFLIPLNILEKTVLTEEEIKEMRNFFRMESITRSLEIIGIMSLSNRTWTTTLNQTYQEMERN